MEVTTRQSYAENYRCNEFPDEIVNLMQLTAMIAKDMDDHPLRPDLYKMYRSSVGTLRDRAEHYYEKRKTNFGFEHMRLRKLIRSCKEILTDL